MKKMMIISIILICILSFTAVSAHDNSTDTVSDEIQQDNGEILSDDSNQKQDLNITVRYCEFIQIGDTSDYELGFESVPDDYNGDALIYIDGEYDRSISVKSSDEINIPRKVSKTYTILACLPETDKYNGLNITQQCIVGKTYIEIPTKIDSSNGKNVVFYAQNGATGTLTVKVNNTVYKKVDVAKQLKNKVNNEIYVSLDNLNTGIQTVEVIYSGDSKYSKLTKKANVHVTNDYNIEFDIPDTLYYDIDNVWYFYSTSKLKNTPIVTINGENFDVENIFHPLYFSVNLSQLTPGVKNIVITYPGDEKFDSKSFNKTFTVLGKIRSEINYKGITYLKLPSDAKGNLSIYLNNTLYKTSPIINGNANLTFDLMGEYSIEINYTGDDYDVEGISQKKIMISPYLDYQEFIRYMDNNILYMEFPDDASGNVTIIQDYGKAVFNEEIADHKINFSFNNLIFNFEPSELSQSSFITVEYTYQNKTHTENIEVIIRPIPSQILKVKDITMYYGDSKTFYAQIKGAYGKIVGAGETVTITIGSKTHVLKTDKNGMVKVKIDNLPGTYKITTKYHYIYKKDDEYLACKVTNKLIVKQPLSLKAATVKKSAKKLVLTATLKNTKAIKNKVLTFKFNGKTYKAKTNSKGVAKVTVSSSILKKLKVGKKITYQVTYLKDTVKKTAVVKK